MAICVLANIWKALSARYLYVLSIRTSCPVHAGLNGYSYGPLVQEHLVLVCVFVFLDTALEDIIGVQELISQSE